MSYISCFEYQGGDLEDEVVEKMFNELFPLMKTRINKETACLELLITKEEYVFVINELTKLHNYEKTMPDAYEDSNTILTSQPIEAVICDRYGYLYDAIFNMKFKISDWNGELDENEDDSVILGKTFSSEFDLSEDYQEYLRKKAGVSYYNEQDEF